MMKPASCVENIDRGAPIVFRTGDPYRLPSGRDKLLLLYAKDYKGVVPADTYLVLGDDPRGGIDSTRIGLVHKNDIVIVANNTVSNLNC